MNMIKIFTCCTISMLALLMVSIPVNAKTPDEMCKDMQRKIATIATMDRLPACAPAERINYEIEKLLQSSNSRASHEKCVSQMTLELHSCMMQQTTVDDVIDCNYRVKRRTKTK